MNPMTSTLPPNDEDIIKFATLENGFAKKNCRKRVKTLFLGLKTLNRVLISNLKIVRSRVY